VEGRGWAAGLIYKFITREGKARGGTACNWTTAVFYQPNITTSFFIWENTVLHLTITFANKKPHPSYIRPHCVVAVNGQEQKYVFDVSCLIHSRIFIGKFFSSELCLLKLSVFVIQYRFCCSLQSNWIMFMLGIHHSSKFTIYGYSFFHPAGKFSLDDQ
jgi:hypothetical protein